MHFKCIILITDLRKEGQKLMEPIQISLAAARVNMKMTQSDVAKALNVSKQTIVNWESGKISPGSMQLDCLSRLYKIPVNNIFLQKKCTLSAFEKEG